MDWLSVILLGSTRAPLNPERGFKVQTKSYASNYQPLTVQQLVDYRNGLNVTIVQRFVKVKLLEKEIIWKNSRLVVLDTFLSSPLTQDFLSLLVKDFEAADAAGLTMILRFHYNDNVGGTCCPPPSIQDADIDIAELHLEQLGQALHVWQHVVLAVEAGFIGVWGEWYYSENYNDPSNNFIPTQQQQDKRRRLVEALLAAFPSKQILLRTPAYAHTFLGDNLPLSLAQAFDGSSRSRLGLHNDCFLASDTDFGTFSWGDPEGDRLWLEKQSNFTFVGGETCAVNPPRLVVSFTRFFESKQLLSSWRNFLEILKWFLTFHTIISY